MKSYCLGRSFMSQLAIRWEPQLIKRTGPEGQGLGGQTGSENAFFNSPTGRCRMTPGTP